MTANSKGETERETAAGSKKQDFLLCSTDDDKDWISADVIGIEFCADVLPAASHQGSARFGEFAGTQCASIVAVAAVQKRHKCMKNWTAGDMNSVLALGSEYHGKNRFRDAKNFVDINGCAGLYELEEISYYLETNDYGVARASHDVELKVLNKLEDLLNEIIQRKQDVSVVYNGFTFGLFCEDDLVYFLNSHCSTYLEEEGLTDKASVLRFHADVAAEALSSIIEAVYSPKPDVSENDRTIHISALNVKPQGKS